MSRFICFFLLFCLLSTACDKVKDSPAPDPISNLELNSLNTNLIMNGSGEIDILALNNIQSEVTIRIKEQPLNGSIILDRARKIFIYTSNPGFFGRDSATYEVCSQPNNCKVGKLYFNIEDTTQPCSLQAGNFTFPIATDSVKILSLPDTFSCGGRITELLGMASQYVQLVNGKIVIDFPKPFQGNVLISFKVCTPENKCDTGTIEFNVNIAPDPINPCISKFKPNSDSFVRALNFVRESFKYSEILKNDSACVGDIIEANLTILTPPTRGGVQLRKTPQGRFLRYEIDSAFYNAPVSDSLTYQITGNSGASGTAKIYFKFQ